MHTRSETYPVGPGVSLNICIRESDNHEPRAAAHVDYEVLKRTFEVMGFRALPAKQKPRWTLSDFEKDLQEAVELFDDEAVRDGPFFLCFSTHGNRDGVCASVGYNGLLENRFGLITYHVPVRTMKSIDNPFQESSFPTVKC